MFFRDINGEQFSRLPFDVRAEDAVIQLDIIGNELRAWAWRAGDEMPEMPQFAQTDSVYPDAGFTAIGLFNNADPQGTGSGSSTFRYVHVANMPIHEIVPEPSTAALGFFAFSSLALFSRRREY